MSVSIFTSSHLDSKLAVVRTIEFYRVYISIYRNEIKQIARTVLIFGFFTFNYINEKRDFYFIVFIHSNL